MMFHLVAYRSLVPVGSTFSYVTPVPDSQVRVEGNNVIVPPGMNHLLAVYAASDALVRARLETPSLRRTMLLDVVPVYSGDAVRLSEHVNQFVGAPLTLDESEPMRFMAIHSGTEEEDVVGLVWLGDGPITPVVSEYFVAGATASKVIGTGGWENVSIAFEQTLPAGRYAVIGARVELMGGVAFRLSFVGQSWRPGWLIDQDVAGVASRDARGGRLGVWGEFPHDQPPTVDVITFSWGYPRVYLDLVKTG
jgi:hypothetical protein